MICPNCRADYSTQACLNCRSNDYYRFHNVRANPCSRCNVISKLHSNGECRKCLKVQGLRECGQCHTILPNELGFGLNERGACKTCKAKKRALRIQNRRLAKKQSLGLQPEEPSEADPHVQEPHLRDRESTSERESLPDPEDTLLPS
jgi:hypothetical protein